MMSFKGKRREVSVKNYPGVYRIEELADENKWKPNGKYRAVRRIIKNGRNVKESAVFDHISDCVAFRKGDLEKGDNSKLSPKLNSLSYEGAIYKFCDLYGDWESFSDMKNRKSTSEFYRRCSQHLQSIYHLPVEAINATVLDKLIKYWKSNEYPKPKYRINFERELDLLKTVLNFYKTRKNPSFLIPIFQEHYDAAEVVSSSRNPLQHLDVGGVVKFLDALGGQTNPQYRVMATTQFGCTLRVGEVAGLQVEDILFSERLLVVRRTISWSRVDWKPSVNPVKNGKQRVVTLPDFVWDELMSYVNNVYPKIKQIECPFLFQLRALPISSKTISYAYARAKEVAGLGHYDFSGTHWVRKSGATIGRDATEDIYAVQQLLDHASVKETQKYTARKLSHIKKVTDAINTEFQTARDLGSEQMSRGNNLRPSMKLVKI